MRDLDAGILGSSRDTASAPRGRTEIELSQSTASVEPDREPSRSASLIKVRHPAGCGTCLDCLKRGRAPVVPEPSRWKRTDHAMSRPVVTGPRAGVGFGGVSWAFNPLLGNKYHRDLVSV